MVAPALTTDQMDQVLEWLDSGVTRAEVIRRIGYKSTPNAFTRVVIRARRSRERAATAQSYTQADSYVYNRDTDTYVTFVPGVPKPVNLPGETHRAMLRAYSNWDGSPATINEICRTFEFPRQWFNGYRKAHGWTHDLDPFTNEEHKDPRYTEEQKVGDLIQHRRGGLYKKWSKEDWRLTQEDAERWRKFELTVLNRICDALPNVVHSPAAVVNPKRNPCAAVLSLADVHLDKYASALETGSEYGHEQCKSIVRDAVSALLSQIGPFNPEIIYLIVGSDYLHFDNSRRTTTRGTPQDSARSMTDMVLDGYQLMIEVIDRIAMVAPCEVILSPGNHDDELGWLLQIAVHAHYRHSDHVCVRLDRRYRQYAEYGNNLIGFTHGDGPKKERLGIIMANEAGEMWSRCRNRMWFVGHLHHDHSLDADGVMVYQCPSISAVDKWHSKMGYTTARRAMAGYLIDKSRGLTVQFNEPVPNE